MKSILTVVLLVAAFATAAVARDKGDWFDVQVTGIDSTKIGTATVGHRLGAKSYLDVQGHMLTVHANGKIYEVSSPKEMVEPGPYRAMYVDRGRSMKIRYSDNGRREDATFRIDSVSLDTPAPAPMAGAAMKELTAPPKDAHADPSKFIITQTPGSHLAICVETLTMRSGEQTCLKYADSPIH